MTSDRFIHIVHSATRVLSDPANLEEGLRATLKLAVESVDGSGGTIWLRERHEPILIARHVFGEKADELRGFCIRADEGIAGRVFQSASAEIVHSADKDAGFSVRPDEKTQFVTRNLITVPICYPGGEVVGVLQVVNKLMGDFDEADQTGLEVLSSIVAMSLLSEELRDQAHKGAVMDYLGKVAHDIANLDARIIGPVWSLEHHLGDLLPKAEARMGDHDFAEKCGEVRWMMNDLGIAARTMNRYAKFMVDVAAHRAFRQVMSEGSIVDVASKQAYLLAAQAKRERNVRVEVLAEEMAPFAIDALLIERAVLNLVSNALAHTPDHGCVTVSILDGGDHVRVIVEDTGAGMPPLQLRRVLAGTATSTTGGTGLGTRIVREIAEAHGGSFGGESEQGSGTKLWFTVSKSNAVPSNV